MAKKILVAYFSASGVTAGVAKEIAAAAKAELYEIKPVEPYTSADLNWMNKQSRSSVEMADPSSRPAIAGKLPDLQQYDAVLVGYPIWWYVEPRIIDTFLEGCNCSGVKLVPFATSGGSGIDKSVASLKQHCPAAKIQQGKLLSRREAAKWAEKLLAQL